MDILKKMSLKGTFAALAAAFFIAGCAPMEVAPEGPAGALTPDERLRLGAIYESKGEEELALREYKAVSREDAFNANAHFALANLLLKRENYEEAEANYKKAMEINPSDGTYNNNLGWLYMEQGDYDGAEREVRAALAKDPARRYIYLDTLGVIHTRSGGFARAEAALIEAAGLVPETESEGMVQIYNHLLALYKETGEAAKAADAARKLRELTGGGHGGGGDGR